MTNGLKNKTEAQKAYTKKLKNALNKLNKDVIPSIEKAIRDYKEPKSRPKTQNTSNTAANDYTNWDEGEPNNSSNVISNENCVAVWPDYWNDMNYANTYEQSGFICEWDEIPE